MEESLLVGLGAPSTSDSQAAGETATAKQDASSAASMKNQTIPQNGDRSVAAASGKAGSDAGGARGRSKALDTGFSSSGLKKSPDAIKLFVGQIPKNMAEDQLRPLFGECGTIYDIVVIRDKVTGNHRGCVFLTYCSREAANAAIQKFHNKMTLPNMHNPMQVKPAHGEMGASEIKLFVGMVPHQATEKDIMAVFSNYGHVEEVYILKDKVGESRGCAFVKYTRREDAVKAIKGLHHTKTMPDAPAALVVKFADNKRRGGRGFHDQQDGRFNNTTRHSRHHARPHGHGRGGGYGRGKHRNHGSQGSHSHGSSHGPRGRGHAAYAHGGSVAHGGYSWPQATMGGPARQPPVPVHAPAMPYAMYSPYAAQSSYAPYAATPVNGYYGYGAYGYQSMAPSTSPGAGMYSYTYPTPMPHPHSYYPMPQHQQSMMAAPSSYATAPAAAQAPSAPVRLYVSHLPSKTSDEDLMTLFAPFGHVLQAVITGADDEDRKHGIVVFEDIQNGRVAVQNMNDFEMGSALLVVKMQPSEGEPAPGHSPPKPEMRHLKQVSDEPQHMKPAESLKPSGASQYPPLSVDELPMNMLSLN